MNVLKCLNVSVTVPLTSHVEPPPRASTREQAARKGQGGKGGRPLRCVALQPLCHRRRLKTGVLELVLERSQYSS